MLFTGMDRVLSSRHPTRRTGAHPVSSATRSNTRGLGEITVGSGSERITLSYNVWRCAMAVPSAGPTRRGT